MIELDKIPQDPGCYIFKDNGDRIIYIGKAKNLSKRVRSYFQKNIENLKTNALVENITSVDFIVTKSEVEALILENNLIKKHLPKYNIDLKDSKRYAYIEITNEDFPRVILARKKNDIGRFYGPFVSAEARDRIIEMLTKIFRLRTCKKLPKKACLRYHMKYCDAPCIKGIAKEEYSERIAAVEMILKGKTGELISLMEEQMKNASKEQEFERALELREKINSLNWLNEKQSMERQKNYDDDIINFIAKDNRINLMVFKSRKGIIHEKQEFEFNQSEEFFEEFLLQYYSENDVPNEIILPEADETIVEFLKLKRKSVVVTVPKTGEKKNLLEIVKKNIEAKTGIGDEKIIVLKEKLRLPEIPAVIECFDISHLSGTAMVASMVQFRNGVPDKKNYRRFKIRTVEWIDDFAAIAEVVRRRYTRLINEKSEMPNLILIDGGKGQLSSAREELIKLGLNIPVAALAKRLEEIFVPGLRFPIILDRKEKALHLLQEIRDESHRFAIKYNRLLRKKEMVK